MKHPGHIHPAKTAARSCKTIVERAISCCNSKNGGFYLYDAETPGNSKLAFFHRNGSKSRHRA